MGVIVPEAEGEELMDICDTRWWSHPRDTARHPRDFTRGAGSVGRVDRVVPSTLGFPFM